MSAEQQKLVLGAEQSTRGGEPSLGVQEIVLQIQIQSLKNQIIFDGARTTLQTQLERLQTKLNDITENS